MGILNALLLSTGLISCQVEERGVDFRRVPPQAPNHDELPLVQISDDPIEGFNRASFALTEGAFDWVAAPVLRGYRFIAPAPVRRSIRNFGANLGYPGRFINNLLQGKVPGALEETGRFLINTTVGIAGLFDPAAHIGLEAHKEDFGQTFGSWGFGPGFYLVIPFYGPSSGRDAFGASLDLAANPATLFPGLLLFLGGNSLSLRVEDVEIRFDAQGDPYPFVRELWAVRRLRAVEDYELPSSIREPETLPAAGALLLRGDASFYRLAIEEAVELPATGEKLEVALWLQQTPAPLVFVLPGVGGYRAGAAARSVARLAYEHGWSVAAVSSVFHWEFLRAGSSSGVPGYTPRDARDLSEALERIEVHIRRKWPDRVTSTALLGLSLGGLHSLFIATEADAAGVPAARFDRVVAVNPPVDPHYSVRQLDRFYNTPLSWDEPERAGRIRETLLKFAAVTSEEMDGRSKLPFDREETQYLMGLAMRYVLMDVLHEVERRGAADALQTEPGRFVREHFYDEVAAYSFEAYFERVLAPSVQAEMEGAPDLESLIETAALPAREDALKTKETVRVIANEDDSLLAREHVEWLRGVLDDRLTVFPAGGHLGNLHEPRVQRAILDALGRSQSAASPQE